MSEEQGPWMDYAAPQADATEAPWAEYGGTEPATMGLPDAEYRQKLHALIAANRPRAEINALIQGQGIDPSQVAGIDDALKAAKQGRGFGVHSVDGNTTTDVADETAGQALYRGVGDVAAGVGDVLGLLGNPLNAGINAIAGTNLSTDLGKTFRDWTGAPEPITDTERYLSTAERSGANALATGGVAGLARAAPGMAGYVANQVSSNIAGDFVGGVVGGATGEGGGDLGAKVGGTAGRVVGSLAGGLTGNTAGVRGAEAAASKLARSLPREAAINSNGTLTAEAHELALRNGVDEDDLLDMYARARRTSDPRLPAERQASREAVRNRSREGEVLPEPTARAPQPQEPAPDLRTRTDAIVDGITQRVAPSEPPAPTTPQGRFDEAGSEGIRLTRGQAEQDFNVQNDENSLRVSATNEGEQSRGFFRQQQEDIQAAMTRLRSNFGPDAGNATDRGQQVKDAVKALRDNGKQGVQQLYRQAEELGGESLVLNTKGIHDAATDVLIDEAVPEGVKRAVSQELARYGIIGEAAPPNEAGITKVTLDDGSSVSFRGPTKQLTASNAEDLRRAVNRLYDPTKPNLSGQSIKPAIDDALEEAISNAATKEGGIGAAYGAARDAHKAQRATYNAKDIIENLVAVKKGTQTDVVLPERAIAQVVGAGKEGLSNIRRVKSLLLSSNHPTSQTAWRAIQHQGIADIFDSAISRNVNHGGGQIGDVVSGAKLNSAIEKFGVDKLRVLLDPEEFNGLMKLRRIVGTATIPISGTVNPSGTATKIINYMKQGTLRFAGVIPGVGHAVNAFAGLAAKGKEIAATRKVLEGITSYDGRAETSRRLDQQARDFVREYIDSGKSGELVPSTINLTATQTRTDK